jgi:glycosyltransferase involved in cell wall biosynthesis
MIGKPDSFMSINAEADRKRHFFHVLPTFAPGGVQIRLAYLINNLRLPARHSIVALDGDTSASSRLSEDAEVDFIPVPPAIGLPGRLLAARHIVKTHNPDLLLTFQWGAIEWALANRFCPVCPHIHLESGFGVEEATQQIPRRVRMRRLALGHIRNLIVPSRTLVDIATNVWRLPKDKILHIPNGVDIEKYAQAPDPDAIPGLTKRPGEVLVGTLTPLRPEKNLSRLIRAFGTARAGRTGCRLVIMGEGGERAKLEALIRELDLADQVILAGHVDAPERALGLLDLYALSSDTEQMPNSINQAMAAGLPVVGLDVGDVKYIVGEENKSFIAPAGDEATFSDLMGRLIADGDLREAMGTANKAHVSHHYALEGMLAAYEKAWF